MSMNKRERRAFNLFAQRGIVLDHPYQMDGGLLIERVIPSEPDVLLAQSKDKMYHVWHKNVYRRFQAQNDSEAVGQITQQLSKGPITNNKSIDSIEEEHQCHLREYFFYREVLRVSRSRGDGVSMVYDPEEKDWVFHGIALKNDLLRGDVSKC